MLENITDAVLLAELKDLVKKDTRLTARLLLHLGEIDTRKLHLAEGYSSMFVYCVQALAMDESTAFKRINAARVARRFPVVLEMVAGGDMHLTGLRLITPYLTAENHAELLAAARRRSKREIEQLIAERFPAPETPTSIRKLPERRPADAALVAPPTASPPRAQTPAGEPMVPAEPGTPPAPMVPAASFALQAAPAPAPERQVTPVGPGRWRLQTTLSAETYEKLRRVQDLARHRLPDGDVAALLDMALDELAHKLEAERFAVRRPRPSSKRKAKPQAASKPEAETTSKPEVEAPAAPQLEVASEVKPEIRSRYIPAETRRRVFARDGARCTFIGAGGHRCTETGFLELDHVVPWARGGANDASTLTLRCRSHNQHAAEIAYGKKFMDRKRRPEQSPESPEPVSMPHVTACARRRPWPRRRVDRVRNAQ